MQSVRVFDCAHPGALFVAEASYLVPTTGALAYPGEGEDEYPNGAPCYLPWYKRKDQKGNLLRGGRSPFHGKNWRKKRRRHPTATERRKRISQLASKLFFECDRNGDGVVTRGELSTAIMNRSLTMRFLGLEHSHVGPFFDVDESSRLGLRRSVQFSSVQFSAFILIEATHSPWHIPKHMHIEKWFESPR